jgi:hypothetical protein
VKGGLAPLEAITAATGNSARALGVDGERGAIVGGKLADLALIEGAPHRNIADMKHVRRVWLGGKEIDRAANAAPIPAAHAHRRLDDFERPDGRSAIDTLWVNQTDGGHDETAMAYTRVLRGDRDHSLFITARMAEKDRPFARMDLPLSRGGVQPVDASAFQGVQFDARGEGEYRLLLPCRSGQIYSSAFAAAGTWQTLKVPFSAGWDIAQLLMLQFEIARTAGEAAWLELDNVRFY